MYVIISDDNANGTFTGTDLNYIHSGLILPLNVQTILANIYQLIMLVIPPNSNYNHTGISCIQYLKILYSCF